MTTDSPPQINPIIRHRAGHLGRSLPRREDRAPLLGKQQYIADMRLPGMLEVAFARSREPHAVITSIDTKDAQSVDGVHAVYTGDDLADVGTFPHFILYNQPVNQRPLAEDRVRYVGSPYAAVVATDRYVAEDAVTMLSNSTEYEPLPTVADIDQALGGTAPRSSTTSGQTNRLLSFPGENEEVARAFEEADHTFSESYISQRQTGLPLEGRGVHRRCQERPPHAVVIHPEPTYRENDPGQDARHSRAQGAGHHARYRWRVRHQDPRVPGGRHSVVDRMEAGASGAVDSKIASRNLDVPQSTPADQRQDVEVALRRRRHDPWRPLPRHRRYRVRPRSSCQAPLRRS